MLKQVRAWLAYVEPKRCRVSTQVTVIPTDENSHRESDLDVKMSGHWDVFRVTVGEDTVFSFKKKEGE